MLRAVCTPLKLIEGCTKAEAEPARASAPRRVDCTGAIGAKGWKDGSCGELEEVVWRRQGSDGRSGRMAEMGKRQIG